MALEVWYIRAMIRHNESIELTLNPCMPWPPTVPGPNVPRSVERIIAARWRWWVPWVRMHLLRKRQSDPTVNPAIDSADSRCLCQRHREQILDLMRDGISMRTIRRHRLDDPRITDEVRAMLVQAAGERQSKAQYRRPAELRAEEKLATRMNLGPIVRHASPKDANNECPGTCAAAAVVRDPAALKEAIQDVRRLVCEHFYLREMRDPELTVRTNRRSYVLPRQVAMYIARQVTGASLEEIGREFGRHHTTVLHSISKIEAMQRSDEALARTITRLVNAVVART